jgi:hypothetical protein
MTRTVGRPFAVTPVPRSRPQRSSVEGFPVPVPAWRGEAVGS